uniref:Uncharacterized protein n=1 Tax=Photinus pyralis TaxID=7054 RepID=A0A1Y1LSD8_PHOPY
MYIYLSKKIAIPNNIRVTSIAWNKEDGFIAVGGEGGLLKVLKLDSGNDAESGGKTKGISSSSNLSVNQTLDGHSETVQVITWNNKFRKLTTSDRSGMIIVWILYKGTWYEEMINNRKKSVVVDMTWSADGNKICIIYEDGGIIVGSVDGNRIWGKEIKNVTMSKVQWSPDASILLFGFTDGNIHIYDSSGAFTGTIELIPVHVLKMTVGANIVGMDWYNGQNGHVYAASSTLAVCCENGHLQLMRNPFHPYPIYVDTKMTISCCSWNHNGSLLAIVGRQQLHDDSKSSNVVQFYNPFGEHLRTLKLPGQHVSCCTWEEGSLRIAFGIDSSVYFANIRPDYKWCYFKNTIAYSSGRLYKNGVCVTFWDIVNYQVHVQYVLGLLDMAAYDNHCVLLTKLAGDDPMGRFGLILCSASGAVVDAKYVDFDVKWVAMNSTHVAAASKSNYILWPYKTPKTTSAFWKNQACHLYHTDYDPTGATLIVNDCPIPTGMQNSFDPICAIALSERYLLIAKESGTIKQYVVPHVVIVKTFNLTTRAHRMFINCNSTRLSLIDMTGLLTVLDISEASFHHSDSENTRLERKDVWAMCWASDNPQLLAIMEKTRMYVFKGIYPEEPISTSGYICRFENLEIQAVMLDEIIDIPDKPSKDHLFKLEVKSLRDTRQLLEKVGIKEAYQFIEDNPHPRLWNLLGEAALKDLNFKVAEDAFIRSQDYSGIQFVKKLRFTMNSNVKRGLVAAYFKNFEEAERLFNENDRVDLTLHLRKTLGDWFRVIRIIKYGYYSTPGLLKNAYNKAGDYFTHINNWSAAKEYYELAKNKKKMIETYFQLEDFKSLANMAETLEDSEPMLADMARGFAVEGDYLTAIKTYLKIQDVKSALKVSVENHQWEQTVQIAQRYRMKEVSQIFINYSDTLIKQNKINRAVEINVYAKYWLTAAKCAIKMARKEAEINLNQPIKIKRMYVCAAHLVEKYKKDPNEEELVDTMADVNLVENCWEGAVAFHLYILAQHQLYTRQIHDAVCTFNRLRKYTAYIPAEKIYSMLALTAYFDGLLGVSSNAFTHLNALPELPEKEKAAYRDLALKIFSVHVPDHTTQHRKQTMDCFNCQTSINDWEIRCSYCEIQFPFCIASGRSIISEGLRNKFCSTCNHVIIEKYLGYRRMCPLCHSALFKK